LKRLSIVLAAALGAGAIAVFFVAQGSAAPHAHKAKAAQGVTFHLVEKSQSFHFVDNPPIAGRNEPPSQGDTFTGTSNLLTRSGKRAGTLYFSCTVASGGRNGVNECFGTFALKGGQLSGITSTGGNSNVTRIAIVGGTGIYEGANGSVVSVSRGNNSPFSNDTFHLLP
jgi:hypothetical protein